MRARSIVTFVAAVLLAGGAARAACAQSLADVAKKEEDRRKTVKQPTRIYTNKDLQPVPPPSTAPPAADRTDKAADPPADKDKKDDKGKADAASGDGAKSPDSWRKRMSDLQAQLDRDQTYLEAVQSRINGLTAEFVNRDDPAQRAVIERERTRNLGELERLRKAIDTDRKAMADFEEEARRAGVPPGWLR